MAARTDGLVSMSSRAVRRRDEDLEGSGAIVRARTGSTDGITAAVLQCIRARVTIQS